MADKSKYQKLEEKLTYKSKSLWETLSDKEIKEAYELGDDYKKFLDYAKTERKVIQYYQKKAEKQGFKNIESVKNIKTGDKLYYNFRDKNLALVVVGKDEIEKGINIVGAHADVPRIDLMQKPLYEDSELALFKTHYYGGIKKYQWLNIPLAMHGTIILSDGTKKEIVIGEKDDDPVFVISDILPHLAANVQAGKTIGKAVSAEKLIIMAGNRPVNDDKVKNKVKLFVLEYLNNEYGIIEEDFISSEIQIVPAIKSRDIGFDRALIGGYGHDDRVCSYLASEAIFSIETPSKTAVTMLVDKEEIGSAGSTGANSFMLHHLYTLLAELSGNSNMNRIRNSLINSACLSSDVSAAINPAYKSVHDSQNAPMLSHGITLVKYTGVRGKGGANDADAEFLGKIRSILNKDSIKWQFGMLGKVDEGGGGTIAKYVSFFGINTIDAGVPVVGMHSPFEIISKADLYNTLLSYKSFYNNYK